MPVKTKKDLEQLVKELQEKIASGMQDRTQAAEDLQVSQAALTVAQGELDAAKEATATAEAARAALQEQLDQAMATAAATLANQGTSPLEDQVNHAPPTIPRPAGSSWSILESMQVTKAEYAEIQRTIRSLVIRATLDWTDDFRRQDPEKLGKLFRAARTAHPILHRYANNWATAAIACQYMQNKRKHAYKQGYISKRRAHQVGDRENLPRGGHGGAAA